MDKEQAQRSSPPPFNESISSSMPRRPPATRTVSSNVSQDMKQPIVISNPVSSQSSWDVEALGSPPRKDSASRAPTPLLSRSNSGNVLIRSNSSASVRKTSLATEILSGSILSRSSSSASRRGVKTPDLYNGESESSDSLPNTPRTCRSPTPGISAAAPASAICSASTACSSEEPRRKSEECIKEDEAFKEAKKEREQFIYQRDVIYHHRFPREQVPYMQSYSHMSLQNDFYTHELLRKLMPEGSPTFYEYCGQVPTDVLDIGCGRGHWAAEVAIMWKYKNCHVTAFDIVDLGRPLRQSLEPEISAHVSWVQGDINKRLPFPSSSFGLVRMSCMGLAVPIDGWRHVITEIRRVLRPGGRVEIIDDELLFPEIQYPSGKPSRNGSSRSKPSRTRSVDSDEENEESISNASTRRSPQASTGSRVHTWNSSPERSEPGVDFHTNAMSIINMENIFQRMVFEKYDLMPRPHQYIEDLMLQIFGNGRSNCMFRADLFVPKSDAFLDKGKGKQVPSKNSGRSSGRPSLDNEGPPSCSHGAPVSLKALRVLGGASTAVPYQPPGFVIWPDSFVPCDPDTLEMYACKSIHTVLSSKHAMANYVQESTDTAGQPLITDAEFDDLTWTYDRLKRTRFNWPDTHSCLDMDEETSPSSTTRPLFNRTEHGSIFSRRRPVSGVTPARQTLAKSLSVEEHIPIRRIRVFQGFKSGPGFDAVELIPLPPRFED